MNFLWTTFTRFEPAADIHAAARHARAQPRRVHAAGGHRRAHQAVVSGRGQRRADVADVVTRRWREYFPYGRVAMGDAERGHLD